VCGHFLKSGTGVLQEQVCFVIHAHVTDGEVNANGFYLLLHIINIKNPFAFTSQDNHVIN